MMSLKCLNNVLKLFAMDLKEDHAKFTYQKMTIQPTINASADRFNRTRIFHYLLLRNTSMYLNSKISKTFMN